MNCDDRNRLMRKPKTTRERWFEQRDDLTGEHSLGDAGQKFFALLFFGIWITDSFFLKLCDINCDASLHLSPITWLFYRRQQSIPASEFDKSN
jgi:hypothetical protein